LDEGQYIKNPQSQTAKTAYALQSEYRIVITGTPVENRILDLWSLFAFAMPGLLGSQTTFKRQYKENDPDSPKRLFGRVRHFMLRRSKLQVAPDLPDRIEETLSCEMEGDQLDLYNAELKGVQDSLRSINTKAEFDKERFNILSSLLRLRQICCHPRLIDPAYADMNSAKLEALLDLVSELEDEGHKVLIFSQFVEMLEIIRTELQSRDCKHLMLTGKTRNREELVNQFQEDESITAFLLSLRAAGSGLNLTAATYVILYDPWWNPAVEAQAIDRTHRIGQENAVNAYRLTIRDSVEDKIQSLQLKKETLANEVVQEDSLHQILDLERLKSILQA
jgi:SNF2 family DNA or RNA helicase